jgi:hypothetical protein
MARKKTKTNRQLAADIDAYLEETKAEAGRPGGARRPVAEGRSATARPARVRSGQGGIATGPQRGAYRPPERFGSLFPDMERWRAVPRPALDAWSSGPSVCDKCGGTLVSTRSTHPGEREVCETCGAFTGIVS